MLNHNDSMSRLLAKISRDLDSARKLIDDRECRSALDVFTYDMIMSMQQVVDKHFGQYFAEVGREMDREKMYEEKYGTKQV